MCRFLSCLVTFSIHIFSHCILHVFQHRDLYLFVLTGSPNDTQDIACNSLQFVNIKNAAFSSLKVFGCCTISKFDPQSMPIMTESKNWDKSGCSLDYVPSIRLPNHILTQYANEIQHLFPKRGSNTNFDAIFRCGGISMETLADTNECVMMLFDANHLSITETEKKSIKNDKLSVNTLSITLPVLPFSGECCSAFSEQHGLFCMSSSSSKAKYDIFRLNLDQSSSIAWDAIKFNNKSPIHINSSSYRMVVIEDGQKLFITSDNINNSNQSNIILDINTLESTEVPPSKCGKISSGIFYDCETNSVYCASKKIVEYFVIDENKWLTLPGTKHSHTARPCLWIENQMLFIAGSGTEQFVDKIEFLDLKEGKEWNLANNAMDFKMEISTDIERVFCSQ